METPSQEYEPVRQAVEAARQAGLAYGAVVCRTSAALAWGWGVLRIPPEPHLTIPKNRRTARLRLSGVVVRKANLRESEIDGGVTTPARTLMDCLRYLPLIEGLCVADSALREGFSRSRLDELAANARGPGAMKIKLNARLATPEAANPFESALRGIALGVTGLAVTPQVPLREKGLFLGRPDLVDRRLRIVLEADSAQFHATVAGINREHRTLRPARRKRLARTALHLAAGAAPSALGP